MIDEVARVADDWRARGKPNYIDGILDGADDEDSGEKSTASSGDLDALFDEVVVVCLKHRQYIDFLCST